MGYITESQIVEIKERISIVDIIAGYVSLKKSGDNLTGLCPFHNEKTPSFTVSEKKGVFHCFGCGAGGDVISFLTHIKNESFNDVIKYLANIAGISLAEEHTNKKTDDYYSINKLTAGYYHEMLFTDSTGKKAFKYLTLERGLSSQMINDYMVGYAPNNWNATVTFLREHNIPVDKALKLGIIIKKQKGSDYYDRFRGRIMFPIKDYKGRVIAFGGRVFDGEEPKYLNSPDSDIYRKGTSLYGIDVAKSYVGKTGCFIFVEGYMDALIMHQHGFGNTVATTGTAVSLYHMNTVSRYAHDAIFLFDGDEAGEKAGERALAVVINTDIEGKLALLPSGFDPDTFLIKFGKNAMSELINNAQPLFNYSVERSLKDKRNVGDKLKAINSSILLLKKLHNSPIKQELYIKKLAELTGISESSVKSAFRGSGTGVYGKTSPPPAYANSTANEVELKMLAIVIDHPEKMHNLLKDGIINVLTNPYITTSIQRIQTLYDNGVKDIKSAVFQPEIDERVKSIISAAMLKDLSGENIDVLYDYVVNKIKTRYYVREQKKLSNEIAKTGAANELLRKKKEIASFHRQ